MRINAYGGITRPRVIVPSEYAEDKAFGGRAYAIRAAIVRFAVAAAIVLGPAATAVAVLVSL